MPIVRIVFEEDGKVSGDYWFGSLPEQESAELNALLKEKLAEVQRRS